MNVIYQPQKSKVQPHVKLKPNLISPHLHQLLASESYWEFLIGLFDPKRVDATVNHPIHVPEIVLLAYKVKRSFALHKYT